MARTFRLRIDPARILRASRIRVGDGFEVRGVPAILLGVSAIVGVSGLASVLRASAPALPEALREMTKLAHAVRGDGDQRRLNA